MNKLWRNWTVHNLLAHPISELVYLFSFGKLRKQSDWIHDVTIPENTENGRG
jgi:hypothetical protein